MSRASVEKVKYGAIKKTVICSTFAGVLVMGLCAHDLTFDVLPLVDLPMNIFIYALVIYGGGILGVVGIKNVSIGYNSNRNPEIAVFVATSPGLPLKVTIFYQIDEDFRLKQQHPVGMWTRKSDTREIISASCNLVVSMWTHFT